MDDFFDWNEAVEPTNTPFADPEPMLLDEPLSDGEETFVDALDFTTEDEQEAESQGHMRFKPIKKFFQGW